jgi:hypothetical protein
MELVEFWRARRALVWYAAILVALAAFTVLASPHSRVNVDVNDQQVVVPHIVPLTIVMSVAMFLTAILASWLGLALNRENATRELSWTRPVPRAVLALRFIAIDGAVLAVAYAFTIVLLWLLVATQVRVVVEPRTVVAFFMGSGVVAMWYALVLILSAGVRGHGGAIAGLLWPGALIVLAFAKWPAGGLIHYIAVFLNVFNPFAYLGEIGHSAPDGTPFPLLWPLDESLRAVIVWCFAAVFIAGAVVRWQRREI